MDHQSSSAYTSRIGARDMKLWKEGDTSFAVCSQCKKRVATYFERREVDLKKPRVLVPDVLVAVCDECDSIAAVPYQSSHRLNEVRARELATLEARIPKHLEDVLGVIAASYGRSDREFRAPLLRYYLAQVSRSDSFARRVCAASTSDLASGKAFGRVSLRVDHHLLDSAWRAARSAGLSNRSRLVTGVIIAAKEDILENRAPRRKGELELVAAST